MIPDYQTVMLPLLKVVSDGKEYKLSDIVEILAKEFNLTKEERAELITTSLKDNFNGTSGNLNFVFFYPHYNNISLTISL